MKILPIAFDSFGVRSQATFVLTDKKIFIDPGIALGPIRYGLPPAREEILAMDFLREKIIEKARKCEIIIVTHYHYDHHPFPYDNDMYSLFEGKIVLTKDITKDINFSGKKRGKIFYEKIKNLAKEVVFADGKYFEFGKTKIRFSKGVWHGEENSKVGRVLTFSINYKEEKLFFGSDAQNLASKDVLEFAIEENPDFAIIDGYPTIFIGYKMSKESFQKSKNNLRNFLENTNVKTIILDHHIVRDISYKEKIKDLMDFAKSLKKEILTAAEYCCLDNLFLEAWRRNLHENKIEINLNNYYKKLFNESS
ncbi:MAG: MBL fold metallo-hydrolase [Candidatus Aenigmarchaeota archaeon]|nr:MBL fold metallo-hydrolase [Candidatus Aenigmarchaeota archaeon]MDW8149269.1 MBL fold metallo-hydrolase [Candidatus Aenigmarchaeota archaeon]